MGQRGAYTHWLPFIRACFLLLVLRCTFLMHPVDAAITFMAGGTNATFHTMDYFQYTGPPYSISNAILYPVQALPVPMTDPVVLPNCEFSPAVALDASLKNAKASKKYPGGTVAFLYWAAGMNAGCHNYYEAIRNLQDVWGLTLDRVGLPPLTGVVLVPYRTYPNEQGGPYGEPYLSHDASLPDGNPVLPTVLFTSEDADKFADTFKSTLVISANIEQEKGPWNELFQHPGYKSFVWIFFIVNVGMVLFAIVQLYRSVSTGSFKADLRSIIFAFGLISTVLYSVAIPLRQQSWTRYIIETIASFFFASAFYLLLLLWCGVLALVQTQQKFVIFRVIVALGILATAYTTTLGLVWLCTWPTEMMVQIRTVSRIITPSIQGAVAVLFAIYSTRFFIRIHQYKTTAFTKRALMRLAWLALAGFVTFVLYAVTNVLSGRESLVGRPWLVLTIMMTNVVASTLRGAAILLILSVRMPKSTDMSKSVSSYGSTTLASMQPSRPSTMQKKVNKEDLEGNAYEGLDSGLVSFDGTNSSLGISATTGGADFSLSTEGDKLSGFEKTPSSMGSSSAYRSMSTKGDAPSKAIVPPKLKYDEDFDMDVTDDEDDM